jgi:hypothetical protein
MNEKINDKLSLEEMIRLARTCKKWHRDSGGYCAYIGTGSNRLHISISTSVFGTFFYVWDKNIPANEIGRYLGMGFNREIRKLYREIKQKHKYQETVKENNQISNGLDYARDLITKQ